MSRNLSLKSRYAVILILLGLVALMETRHPFPFFRLVTFILAFLALAGVASVLRGKLRDGLVVLASLAFGLSIIEATATILENKASLPSRTSAGGRSIRDASTPRKQIRNPASRFTERITRSIRICCARPARSRPAQRSFFSAIPSPSEKA
jgi:hypothetical protein